MWQTDGGAKQCTGRGGPSLTEDSQTERELTLQKFFKATTNYYLSQILCNSPAVPGKPFFVNTKVN